MDYNNDFAEGLPGFAQLAGPPIPQPRPALHQLAIDPLCSNCRRPRPSWSSATVCPRCRRG